MTALIIIALFAAGLWNALRIRAQMDRPEPKPFVWNFRVLTEGGRFWCYAKTEADGLRIAGGDAARVETMLPIVVRPPARKKRR
jgi:hypothetical protein